MNINEKIIDSVQKTTGLRCYEGEPGQLVRGSFAYFYPLQTAGRGNEVAIFFFTRPTIERLDRRRSLDYAMLMASRWLNGLYTYSGLKFADVVSQNQFQDTSGGYGIGMRVVLIDEARNAGGSSIERVLLTLSDDPLESATLSGAGKYIKGKNATAGATALHGFTFSKWTDGTSDVSTDNPYTFEIDADTNLVAVCTRNNYTLSLSSGTGISGVSGGGTYPYETQVTATATVAHGFTFSNWTSSGTVVSTSNPYTFSLLDNTSLVANTTRNNYTVTLSEATQGTTSSLTGSGVYPYETSVTVEAVPVTGYDFIKWTDGTSDVSTSNPYTFSLSDDTSLVAVCDIATYRVGFGEPYPAGAFQSLSGDGTYQYGATVTLSATMNHGYSFDGWAILNSRYYDNPYTFQIYGNTGVYPRATANSYTVATSVNDQTMGSASGGGSYTYNTSCTLTATAETGYHFVNWTVSGSQVSASNPYTFTVEDDTTVQANFAIDAFTVTTAVNDQTMGSATGGGQYQPNSTATVVATPTSGYEFVEWQVGGSTVSTNATYSFTVTQNVTVTAVFRVQLTPYLTFTAKAPNSTVQLSSGSSYPSVSLEYSTDGQTWTSFTNAMVKDKTGATSSMYGFNQIVLQNVGDFIQVRGNNSTFGAGSSTNWTNRVQFYCFGNIKVSGKIESLARTTLTGAVLPTSMNFACLFWGDSTGNYVQDITEVDIEIPSITPWSGQTSYNNYLAYDMFHGNVSLVKANVVFNNINASHQGAYGMFYQCTSLVDTDFTIPSCTGYKQYTDGGSKQCPECNGQYTSMFYGCTSLEETPILNGLYTHKYSYQRSLAAPAGYMFQACSSLKKINLSGSGSFGYSQTPYNSSTPVYTAQYWMGGVSATGTISMPTGYTGFNEFLNNRGSSGAPGDATTWPVEYY